MGVSRSLVCGDAVGTGRQRLRLLRCQWYDRRAESPGDRARRAEPGLYFHRLGRTRRRRRRLFRLHLHADRSIRDRHRLRRGGRDVARAELRRRAEARLERAIEDLSRLLSTDAQAGAVLGQRINALLDDNAGQRLEAVEADISVLGTVVRQVAEAVADLEEARKRQARKDRAASEERRGSGRRVMAPPPEPPPAPSDTSTCRWSMPPRRRRQRPRPKLGARSRARGVRGYAIPSR